MKIYRQPSGRAFTLGRMLEALSVCILLINPLTTVSADTSAHSVSARVSVSGLDLTKPGQLETARERLKAAAKRLCMNFYDARKADNHQMFVDCYREALADALERLDVRLAMVRMEPSDAARRHP